jgi:methionyl-tRNA formyltransferase
MGALAICQALTLIEAGVSRAVPQDESQSTYAPKIERPMARLDFTRPAVEVARVVRAFDPRPGAYASLRGQDVKCFSARLVGDGTDEALDEPALASPPGTVRRADDDGLVVRCGIGAVRLLDVQPSGKPRMTAASWARGRGVATGDAFALPA